VPGVTFRILAFRVYCTIAANDVVIRIGPVHYNDKTNIVNMIPEYRQVIVLNVLCNSNNSSLVVISLITHFLLIVAMCA
jgi:hypothetical protein